MLVIRIELHSANTGRVTELGVMRIANVGGNVSRGDYEVRVQRKKARSVKVEADFDGWNKPTIRKGEVKNYPRLSYNIWRLVSRALRSAFPEE